MVLPLASSRSQLFPRPRSSLHYSQTLPHSGGSLVTVAKVPVSPPAGSVNVTSGVIPSPASSPLLTVKGFEQLRGGALQGPVSAMWGGTTSGDGLLEFGEGMNLQADL